MNYIDLNVAVLVALIIRLMCIMPNGIISEVLSVSVLRKSSCLQVHLRVAPPLVSDLLNGLKLGLEGEHQYLNAGLAVALCSTWLQRTGHLEISYLEQTVSSIQGSKSSSHYSLY